MGGFGSGRRATKPTVESTRSYTLHISSLKPLLRWVGERHTVGSTADNDRFSMLVSVDLRNQWNCFVELTHRTRDWREGDRVGTYQVTLTKTKPTFGGYRWWFLCPKTGYRTTTLFLPQGGWYFWSRQAYGLGYASQRTGRIGRLQRRAAAVNRQLGGKGLADWDRPMAKPKWMRWRTYEQKFEAWWHAAQQADAELEDRVERLLQREPPPAKKRRARRSDIPKPDH